MPASPTTIYVPFTFVRCHFAAPPYSSAMFIPANARPLRTRCSQAIRRLIVPGAVALCCGGVLPAQTPNAERATVIVVVGAPGEEEYGRNFSEWASALSKAAGKGGAKEVIIGLQTNNTAADREQLQQALNAEPNDGAELW